MADKRKFWTFQPSHNVVLVESVKASRQVAEAGLEVVEAGRDVVGSAVAHPLKAGNVKTRSDDNATISPLFKVSLLVLVVVTFGSLIVLVALSILLGDPTPSQQNGIKTVDWSFRLGFGALLGLVGGKAL